MGKGQSVFAHAKVIIQKHAQLSDSFVSQKFMLLDKTSKAEAIPSLEIEADEVKASHAATISPLDQEKLFYVMARGLSYVDASKLLIEGFLELPDSELLGGTILDHWVPSGVGGGEDVVTQQV